MPCPTDPVGQRCQTGRWLKVPDVPIAATLICPGASPLKGPDAHSQRTQPSLLAVPRETVFLLYNCAHILFLFFDLLGLATLLIPSCSILQTFATDAMGMALASTGKALALCTQNRDAIENFQTGPAVHPK